MSKQTVRCFGVAMVALLGGCSTQLPPLPDGAAPAADRGLRPDGAATDQRTQDLSRPDGRLADGRPADGRLADGAPPPTVTVTTDKAKYAEKEAIVATLRNRTAAPVFVDGCTAFRRERQALGGKWDDQGVDTQCATNPPQARVVAPGATYSETLLPRYGGTWRVSADYAASCTAGKPFKPVNCTGMQQAVSAPYDVEVGKYTVCFLLNLDYVLQLEPAKNCAPSLPVLQCQREVPNRLDCPCPLYVQDDTKLRAIESAWVNNGCAGLTWPCPGLPCVGWKKGNCVAQTTGQQGKCSP
ncbi:MAG: hypothetical protein IT371_28525 [Deltaproteobacteria bacterium]|nr:hypothetical protein [Deltaproteobacteria bacterium]